MLFSDRSMYCDFKVLTKSTYRYQNKTHRNVYKEKIINNFRVDLKYEKLIDSDEY